MNYISRITAYVLIIAVSFLFVRAVSAQVVISEIMYDLEGSDADREWIEIQNTSGADLDISAWKFFEANTNHGLTPFQGDAVLSADEYAIIAKDTTGFLTDWPNFTGTLLDSSFSLSNTGESLAMKDGNLTVIDQVDYLSDWGATGDGNSLQESSGWVADTPTPGAQNNSGSGGGGGGGSGGGSSSESSDDDGQVEISEMSAEIITKTTLVAGVENIFLSSIKGYRGEKLETGKYVWNLGDGNAFTERDKQERRHTYVYPGDYVVILDYYKNIYVREPDASDRALVTVITADVSISSFESQGDYFAELANNSSYEFDLSGWIIKSSKNSFKIPKNTVILPGKRLAFSSSVTGIQSAEQDSLTLLYPNGKPVSAYAEQSTETTAEENPPAIPEKEIVYITVSPEASQGGEDIKEAEEDEEVFEGEPNLLEASVVKGFDENSNNKLYIWLTALFGLILVAINVVFLMRKKTQANDIEAFADQVDILE